MKKNILIIISIVAILLLSISISYAFFYYRNTLNDITLNSGEIAINFDDTNNTFSSISNYPKKDVFGKIDSNYYDFSVSEKVIDEVIYYEIQIKEESNNTLDPRYIKVYLTDQNDNSIVEPVLLSDLDINSYNNNHIVYKSHILEDNQIDKYRLRIWVGESYTENTAKTFQFKVNLYARNGEESINNVYTVTFDANGGNVDLQNKKVLYNSEYGYLPAPTKEGYTFLGWNGKNLINISNLNINFDGRYYIDTTSNPKYILKPSLTYILSFDYTVNSNSNNIFASVGYGISSFRRDIKSSSHYNGVGNLKLGFTSPESFSFDPPYIWFRFVRMGSAGSADVDISNIQLEEGTTATAYEPYYVTSDIKVTQNKNHTLTAIWQENNS